MQLTERPDKPPNNEQQKRITGHKETVPRQGKLLWATKTFILVFFWWKKSSNTYWLKSTKTLLLGFLLGKIPTQMMHLKQSVTFIWILIRTNIRIYSCQENNPNEYPNIFVWTFLTRTNIRMYSYERFWHERISEYICIQKMIRTNLPNKYSDQKYSNI